VFPLLCGLNFSEMNRILNVTKAPRGNIVLVDDDNDEHELFAMALEDLGIKNKLRSFYDGKTAFTFLKEQKRKYF
jgi:CheY-like chemotaxis protein